MLVLEWVLWSLQQSWVMEQRVDYFIFLFLDADSLVSRGMLAAPLTR